MNDENDDENNKKSDKHRDANDSRICSAKLVVASSMLIAFTLVSAVVITAWGPLVPEAVAVGLDRGKTPFSEYVILHESWHSIAASRHALSCER